MPTVLPDRIAIDRQTLLFAKEEASFATEAVPDAASQILIAGEGSFAQARGFIEDEQRRNTFSRLSRIGGRFETGTFSLPAYIKPVAAGTPPECAALLKALFGREAVTANTSVVYALLRIADTRPSLTVWISVGHFVYRILGGLVNEGRFPVRADNSAEAVARGTFGGLFAEARWTGTDELSAAPADPSGTITVKDARKFTVGSRVVIGNDDNSGAGFEVTAVNEATKVLTISPDITGAPAVDTLVKPWVPTGSESGTLIHGRLGSATRGGVTLPLLSGEITVQNNIEVLNDEKNGQDYASRYINGQRTVDITTEIVLDANAPRFFSDAKQQSRADMVFPLGNAAGKIVEFVAKNVEFDPPEISGATRKVARLGGPAFGSSTFDDELALTFK